MYEGRVALVRRILLLVTVAAMMAVTATPGFAQQNLPERVCFLEETGQIPSIPRIGVPEELGVGCTIITGQPPNRNPI